MSTVRLRSDLTAIPVYKQGKSAVSASGVVHKLSSNENPYPPLPSVVRAIGEQLSGINVYPNMADSTLADMIGERFSVPTDNIVFGSGSVEIISQLIRATTSPGEEVLFAWRSFEAYPLLALAAGATPVMVPLDAHERHDLPAMLDAITERTRLVIVCNPNNPTGTTISAAQLDEFLDQVPSNIVVLIDEAYLHFNHNPDSPAGIDYFRRYDNVVISHTFSKAYGLAGLRVGYAIAPLNVADALRKVALPFGVSTLARAAAVASLEAETELAARVDALVEARNALAAEFTALGLNLPASDANFFWLPLGDNTTAANDVLEMRGVLGRAFPGVGIRVSIGDSAANAAFADAITALLRLKLLPLN